MLEIALFGRFDLQLDGEPVALASRPLQKLIAYLALDAGRAVPRAKLAGVLWMDSPESTARKNLRNSLWLLRQAIGEEYLLTTRNTVAFNAAADYRLDAEVLSQSSAGDELPMFIEAVSLYQGELLPGFYDDWLQQERDRLQAIFERRMQTLLDQLTAEKRWSDLITWAEHWIAHAFAPEPAYRALMAGCAALGDQAGVAKHYQRCQKALQEELGVEPSAETHTLFERLTSGEQQRDPETVRLPVFLEDGVEPERPVFVGREVELARLDEYLKNALEGNGQVAFLAGDAGSGKTSIMKVFAALAGERHPELLVAWGTCNAFGGPGDPFLPFRKALTMLTGDVEEAWSAGTITTSQARLLWEMMPVTTRALLDYSPDLLDTLIPTAPLINRLDAVFPFGQPVLEQLKDNAVHRSPTAMGARPQLFEQAATMLRRLAQRQPIVLLLDDLQWADRGSIELLFHLGRSLSGARLLVLGAYRSDEVTTVRDHSLGPVLAELRRTYGDVWLDLNQISEKAFVDAYIDSEANRLDDGFRETFANRTAGHPLFTVELLRDMQERGDLVKDASGAWVIGPALDWNTLPARVEGAVESRIGRLDEDLRQVLTAAAIEGEVFTAQVLASITGIQERKLIRLFSTELQGRHQLVIEQATAAFGGRQISRFRFSHILFQHYLYGALGEGERRSLHGDVAAILEELYADRLDEVTIQLAHHYIEAGANDKALPYLLAAGDNARLLYAFEDTLHHYRRALAILQERRDFEGASQVLMKIGLTYHGATEFELSSQAYQESFLMRQQAESQKETSGLPVPIGVVRTNAMRVTDLDPITVHDQVSFRASYQLFGALMTLNQDLDVVPDMTESWQISEGGRVYEFRLRDGLFWSDGQPVTAHDFAYRLRRELSLGEESLIEYRWNEIKAAVSYRRGEATVDELGIEVVDSRTLRLLLERPTGTFIHELVQLAPVPAHIVDKHGSLWAEPENIVTCGPYLLESWDKEQAIVLRRNPHYYGDFSGNVSRVEIRFIDDTAEIIEAYEGNELDIVDLPNEGHWAAKLYSADYISWPEFRTVKLNLNTRRFPFDNRRIRRSLALATDRHLLAETAANGLVTPATGGYIPLGLPGHRPGIALPYDLERARRILFEEGYPGGQGLPLIRAMTHKTYAHLTDMLDRFWIENLGLNIEWAYVNWEEYDRRLDSGQVDLFMDGIFAPTPNLDNLMEELPIPRRYWPGEEFRILVDKARTVTDPAARMSHYQKAEDILLEEIPLFPLYYGQNHLLVKPWIKNYRPRIRVLDGWKDVIVEPHIDQPGNH